MKTALLAQNDNLSINEIKQNVGRSVFDLSHSVTFPIDVDGAILPICCIETVPSDSFEISVECLLRQLCPLKVPVMTNLRLNTAFYWCDNRLAWKKWDRFIEGGRSGNEVYEIPTMYNVSKTDAITGDTNYSIVDENTDDDTSNSFLNIQLKNSLHTYFGISFNQVLNLKTDSLPDHSEELPIAFPFFDYQLICRDNYTDIDRLLENADSSAFTDYDNLNSDWAYENLFPADEDEIKLIDGPQYKSGFNTGDDTEHVSSPKGFVLDKVRYHNVRDDYFTTSKRAPMRGDSPAISLGAATTNIDFSESVADVGASLTYASGTDTQYLTTPVRSSSTDGTKLDVLSFRDNNYNATQNNSTLLKALNKAEVGISVNTDFTYAEILLLSQLTIWETLNMLHEPYYDDFLNAHFTGVTVGETAIEKPQYIGGTSQIIHINEIEQTSASTETSALGTVGATAHSLENNYVGKYYCNSFGWLIGLVYIQPEMLYNPALPRGFSRRTKEDFYFPEFANLSMQAILNKEIFFSNDSEWNNTAFGYTGCFDELRSIPNKVAGDLLNNSYQDLKAWVLRREFSNDNKPSMNTSFLSEKGNIDKTAWQVPGMPAFMLQCANYIKAVRPLPYVAIPKAI